MAAKAATGVEFPDAWTCDGSPRGPCTCLGISIAITQARDLTYLPESVIFIAIRDPREQKGL